MGMNAKVLAVGVFSESVHSLPLFADERWYRMPYGTKIIVQVFPYCTGSGQSRELASCFGIDPWDFNNHVLERRDVNLDALSELVGKRRVYTFLALCDAGFKFYFLPEG